MKDYLSKTALKFIYSRLQSGKPFRTFTMTIFYRKGTEKVAATKMAATKMAGQDR